MGRARPCPAHPAAGPDRTCRTHFAVDVEIASVGRDAGRASPLQPAHRRLELSEMLPLPSRTFQLAHQLAYPVAAQGHRGRSWHPASSSPRKPTRSLARRSPTTSPPRSSCPMGAFSRRPADALRHRRAAASVRRFLRAGLPSADDAPQRPGDEGVPFHLIRVDIAGNISKRFSASGIHIARFGAACPRWNVYDAFATPGMLRVQVSKMPDGQAFFCVARTVEPAGRNHPARRPTAPRIGQLSIGLGCAIQHARELVYSDGLNLDDPADRDADRRLLPHLPARRLLGPRHAVAQSASGDRREPARTFDLCGPREVRGPRRKAYRSKGSPRPRPFRTAIHQSASPRRPMPCRVRRLRIHRGYRRGTT